MQYAEALNVIRETALAHVAKVEEIDVAQALGRVVAANVVSELKIPPFTNSSVDGFAIPFEVSANATDANPVTLKIAGQIFPGEIPRNITPAGHAWEIMTGAPVPTDCTACAKVEDTTIETPDGIVRKARAFPKGALSVSLTTPLTRDENLRFAGTDFDHGTRVVSVGDVLKASHLMALSSVGVTRVQVCKRPRVVLLSTGKEIVEPGTALKPGEIYNSTRIFLEKTVSALGCDVEVGPTIADEPAAFLDFMRGLLKTPPDILVTTGAVSMGSADFIRPALEELGASVLFHRVDIRPGKPILFARLGQMAIFGLPGNPISGVVGARFFIDPYLRVFTKQKSERSFKAKLATAFKKPGELRGFYKAQLEIDDGEARVHLLQGQPSYMVRPLLQSSAWAVLREGVAEFATGDLVEVFPEESVRGDMG